MKATGQTVNETFCKGDYNLILVITRWETNCAPVIFEREQRKKENKYVNAKT
jgi:hypothetical protein